jgi:class 3 adenylate cyclase
MNTPNYREPGRLLVVDDNKVNRILLSRGLEQQGHHVSLAENGKEAMELLGVQEFDMILLDIEMPEMNGFEVLEACLADPHLRDIPIIMTSASDELSSVVKCIEMGAEDFLTKPLDAVLLRARVNASLEKKRLHDQQRKLLERIASTEVANETLNEGFSLGGKKVDVSVMFSDIRSFTTISENQDPSETIELLNTYFTLMFEPITERGGIVNQILGDGLMAIFGAPIESENHRQNAVEAGLEMLEMLEGFNQDQKSRGKVELQMGIGIASGSAVAGYTGSDQRAIFTCIGDVVNLASRIEAHTKIAQRPLIIDGSVKAGISDDFQLEELGSETFKGKNTPVEIYSVRSA